jgi:hypothetical protein
MRFLFPSLVAASLIAAGAASAGNVLLWDTSSSLSEQNSPENRSNWKAVPTDLLSLEKDPPKASSDPGYYGREYVFRGDAIVENHCMAAVFWAAQGQVVLYAKGSPSPAGDLTEIKQLGNQVAEIGPLEDGQSNGRINHVEILRNAADEVLLQVSFATKSSDQLSCRFDFGKGEVVGIQPSTNAKGISIKTSLQYAVAPSFIGDDLIFNPMDYPSDKTLYVPADSLLLGLVEGGNAQIVATWPKGQQAMRFQLGEEKEGQRFIERLDFENNGQSLYLGMQSGPGIWHKEQLDPSYLEKDVPLKWKRPFAARWKTQLLEEGTMTTFAFRSSKGNVWRGVPGSYEYPVWFDGEDAFFHLSKKVPPKGEAIIYSLEGQDTPLAVSTPVDLLKETIGRPEAESILDVAGRKLRTHHRRGGDGVHRACTCGCTEAIQAVFEAGDEVSQKGYIEGALDDMVYFVHRHVDRINEYRSFAEKLTAFLQEKAKESPDLKPFIDSLQETVSQIPQEYEVQKENMKSFEYADGLTRKTLALTGRHETNNVSAYMELLKDWRAMGGAQDYVLARCHMVVRKLCQDAGYGCVHQPAAVSLAMEVRKRCKECLRNPDGYEIWADY